MYIVDTCGHPVSIHQRMHHPLSSDTSELVQMKESCIPRPLGHNVCKEALVVAYDLCIYCSDTFMADIERAQETGSISMDQCTINCTNNAWNVSNGMKTDLGVIQSILSVWKFYVPLCIVQQGFCDYMHRLISDLER